VVVTEHPAASCTAPADCVESSAVVTPPEQKHPASFQSRIAAQHALCPGAVWHGAKSFAFVKQCVPTDTLARARAMLAAKSTSEKNSARRRARGADARPRGASTRACIVNERARVAKP
jgi:hypothetical protein